MSLPDYLLDEPDDQCEICGERRLRGWSLCAECAANLVDLDADAILLTSMLMQRLRTEK